MTAPPCFPFIVGRGGSGTTLVRAMFDSHPEVAIPRESHFVVNMGRRRRRYERANGLLEIDLFLKDLSDHFGFQRWHLPPDEVTTSFSSSPPENFPDAIRRVFALNARFHGKSRYGDKTPGYVMSMRLLARLLPESRFIHVIRDGRDVSITYLERGWGPKTLAGNALYWRRFVRHGRKEGGRLGPNRYLEVRYEHLLEDPEGELRTLCRFADLEFHEDMLRYFEQADKWLVTARRRQSHAALRLPPTKGIREWRREMSDDQLMLFEALAGDLLTELGYERVFAHVPVSARLVAERQRARIQANRVGNGLGKLRRKVFSSVG